MNDGNRDEETARSKASGRIEEPRPYHGPALIRRGTLVDITVQHGSYKSLGGPVPAAPLPLTGGG